MKIRNFSIGKFVIATLYASAWLSMHNVPAQEWDRSQEDILIHQENYVKNIFAGLKSSVELTYIMRKFPKGVIHSHLTGALTPENYLNEAIKADLHFDKSEFIFFKKEDRHVFKSENIESAEVLRGKNIELQRIYFNKTTIRGESSDEDLNCKFFKSFDTFETIEKHAKLSDLLTYLLEEAHDQNVLYSEVSKGFEFDIDSMCEKNKSEYIHNFPNNDDFSRESLPEEVLKIKLNILCSDQNFRRKKEEYINYIDEANKLPESLKKIGFSEHIFSINNPNVIRLNVDVNREALPPTFFGDLALAAQIINDESQRIDPRVLGVVISGREHNQNALHNRTMHFKMISFFRKLYPHIKFSIHAGELTHNFATHADMKAPIRDAILIADASRIGHGVSLEHDQDFPSLLKISKEKNICFEICLTSNEKLLQIKYNHPFPEYLKNNINVTLNSDDPGVLGTNMTKEYCMAVQRFNVTYNQLKMMTRNQIRYSFLKGDEIFQGNSYVLQEVYAQALRDNDKNIGKLINSLKGRLQYRLEQEFLEFEKWVIRAKENDYLSVK